MLPLKSSHLAGGLVIIALLGGTYAYKEIETIPSGFPVGKNFTIGENETLKSVSIRLEDGHYVHSALLFRALISSRGRDRHLKAGGYSFTEGVPLKGVVHKFATGHPDVPLVSVTIP